MVSRINGDHGIYRRLFGLMVPIMIQNGITNFVNMLDNIMIGRVGTVQMTGVAVTNQLFFVFNLCVFGAVSGAGIFTAQFYGRGDHRGVRHTFRFKVLFCSLLTLGCIALFRIGGRELIGLYMQGEGGAAVAASLEHGWHYMQIMLIGLLPYTLVQCYSSTLREMGNPVVPMLAGVAAVGVNLCLNWLLIFGVWIFPELGVAGAAIATVVSRFTELGVVMIYTHCNAGKFPFIVGAYRSLRVPGKLVGQLVIKGLPLMLNETLWAAGVAAVNQSYSMRGLNAVGAINISQTFWNVFSIAYMAVGAAIGIILGQMLGANQLREARESARKMIAVSGLISIAVGAVYAGVAEFIPMAYNTEPEIRRLATRMMQIAAVAMPFEALTHASYFTMRSGGRMLITMIFDCGFMWGLNVPVAFLLSRFTGLSVLWIYGAVQAIAVVKSLLGIILVERGGWVKNIVQQ